VGKYYSSSHVNNESARHYYLLKTCVQIVILTVFLYAHIARLSMFLYTLE